MEKLNINAHQESNNTQPEKIEQTHAAEAAYWFGSAGDIQKTFAKKIEALDQQRKSISLDEFEKWEDDYAYNYDLGKKEVYADGMNLDDEAKVLQEIIAFPNGNAEVLRNTIEARAGEFYRARSNALTKAINESDKTDEEKKKELDLLVEFVENAYSHISMKYMDDDRIMDYGPTRYEMNRTFIHNATIKSLNNINNLAKSYNLRPFTPRNFWPSDLRRAASQTDEEKMIFRYDRDIVSEYYSLAFPKAVEEELANRRR